VTKISRELASTRPRPPRPAPAARGLVGRYLLALLARPLLATLLCVMPALLLERLLRLFDLLAVGGPVGMVARLLLFLVPHYLGLAIPAAFFISVFMVIARLGDNHELDALQNAGFSLKRLSLPFLLVGLMLAVGGLGLYGYAQPYARYAFRAAYHAVTNMGWNASVPAGEFTHVADGVTATADKADAASGELRGVFIHQKHPDGSEVITTAGTAACCRTRTRPSSCWSSRAARSSPPGPMGTAPPSPSRTQPAPAASRCASRASAPAAATSAR
jgi:lipopolysaccharide export system permease protein